MEMTISEGYEDRFRGPEKQEEKWVEIFRVEVHRAYPGFQTTNSRVVFNTEAHFDEPSRPKMVFYIRDNM
ncbi:unnamed protein product [Brassica rapa subsp. trilocularis]